MLRQGDHAHRAGEAAIALRHQRSDAGVGGVGREVDLRRLPLRVALEDLLEAQEAQQPAVGRLERELVADGRVHVARERHGDAPRQAVAEVHLLHDAHASPSEPWNPRSGLKPPTASSSRSAVCRGAQPNGRETGRARGKLLALTGRHQQVDELATVGVDQRRARRGYFASAGCSPHSTFSWPAQRPARGSSPGITCRVQCVHPIDG